MAHPDHAPDRARLLSRLAALALRLPDRDLVLLVALAETVAAQHAVGPGDPIDPGLTARA